MKREQLLLPEAKIETLENAVVTPLADGNLLPGGVFHSDGTLSEIARTMLSRNRLSGIPERPEDQDVEFLKGRHLFGGIARIHFGHFLVETTARLWALAHIERPVDGIILQPLKGRKSPQIFSAGLKELVSGLTGNLPLHPVSTPVRVEELVVATQGVGHLEWSVGTPEYRSFMRERLESRYEANGPEDIYISRRRLVDEDKRIDREDEIELLMSNAGYKVFHPQQHSIAQQIGHYKAARRIVGFDGSAFHLAAHLLQPGTKVGLIMRRQGRDVFRAFARQLSAFSDIELCTIHPLAFDQIEDNGVRINLHRIKKALHRNQFI